MKGEKGMLDNIMQQALNMALIVQQSLVAPCSDSMTMSVSVLVSAVCSAEGLTRIY